MAKHVLFLYVDPSDKLYDLYKSVVDTRRVNTNSDSGFDLFCPETTAFEPYRSKKIDFRVKAAMFSLEDIPFSIALDRISSLKPVAFYMYARSSISKTNFRLANNVGIIDSGYRGPIGAFFDAAPWNNDDFSMMEKQRVVQLCHPNLEPFHVVMVNSLSQLGVTERGEGGFGSTGK